MPLGARAKAPAVLEQRGLDVAERETERETESETEENGMEVEGESARDNPPTGERRRGKRGTSTERPWVLQRSAKNPLPQCPEYCQKS